MGLLPDVSSILALMYTDIMTVYRYTDATDADGASVSNLVEAPKLSDVPCRLSLGGKDSPTKGQDHNPTLQTPVIIYAPDIALQNGDYVVVLRDGREAYKGYIGLPSPYRSSSQASFMAREGSL